MAALPDGTPVLPCRSPLPPGLGCVPGGPFMRGSDDGPENTRPRATVWLQTYYMDTERGHHGEYKACEKAGCAQGRVRDTTISAARASRSSGSAGTTPWPTAAQGKHLPSEAQWEKAARGPDGALYPWGDEPATCERAMIKEKRRRSCGVAKQGEQARQGPHLRGRSRAPGVYGLYDMSGNAWEWVADWASESYRKCGEACAGVEPRGPCGGSGAVQGPPRADRPRRLVVLGRRVRDGDLPPSACAEQQAVSPLRLSLRRQPGPGRRARTGSRSLTIPRAAASRARARWLSARRCDARASWAGLRDMSD
jgi:sulfatase modifying factor 1